MAITYSTKKDFGLQELENLFLSVKWSSDHFPDKLVVAMRNFAPSSLRGTAISSLA